MRIFREKAGLISPDACWVCLESCYIYVAPTLWQLVWIVITQWRHDRHLSG